MKNRNKFLSTLLLPLLLSLNCQNNLHTLKIKLTTPLDPNSKIYIVGNHEQLGNWNPDSIELKKKNQFWEGEFFFNPGEQIEFKFTRGSWETEALDQNGKVFNNYSLNITKDTVLTFSILSWQEPANVKRFKGQITGKAKYHKKMEFKDLIPRDIIVWLPPEYDENPEIRYPVLYMHDGQNIIDPATSFNKIDWQIDETADSMICSSIIEPIIVVGIYNTKDRDEEYSNSDKGRQYGNFIIQKLKPFIDKNYRTLPGRINTAIGGSSMGGLAAFLIAWNFSDYFSKAACYSPAFKYEEFDHTKKIEDFEGEKKDLMFFIYNGGTGIDTMLQNGVDKMINALLNNGFEMNKNLFVKIDPVAMHNEKSWAKQVTYMLELFFPKIKVYQTRQ